MRSPTPRASTRTPPRRATSPATGCCPRCASACAGGTARRTFWYGNFRNQDPDSLAQGWETYDARPRFGTNWMGLRGQLAVLSEGYSNADFRTRVTATYDFVHEVLSLVAEQRAAVLAAVAASRRRPARLGGRALGARPAHQQDVVAEITRAGR